jgi:hypothetical protein
MQINRKWLLVIAVCGSVAVTVPALHADDDEGGGKTAAAPAGNVSMEKEMGAMSKALKIISKQVADPTKNSSTLAAVLDLEQHTVAAKGAALRTAATMPTADAKAAKQADFQGDMVTLLRHELDLEEDLLANENDKAVKAVADLHDLETQGHKEFRPKKGD